MFPALMRGFKPSRESGSRSKLECVSKRRAANLVKHATSPELAPKSRPPHTVEQGESPRGIVKLDEGEFTKLYALTSKVCQGSARATDIIYGVRRNDGAQVVIKTLDRSRANTKDESEWRRVAEYLLNVPRIPGLCQIHEAFDTRSVCYCVMERCRGKDLYEQLASNNLRTEEEMCEVVRQLFRALRDLHSTCRIHMDLKLKNIVVDVDRESAMGRVKPRISLKIIDLDTVMDWNPNYQARVVLGSDGYIAPEAYDGKYSPASDVYSAGVVMFRLLTKKFPHPLEFFDDKPGENYVGSRAMRLIRERLRREPINFMRAPLPELPKARDLLTKLLTFSPGERLSAEQALQHSWLATALTLPPSCAKPKASSQDVAAASTCDSLPDFPVGDDIDSGCEDSDSDCD